MLRTLCTTLLLLLSLDALAGVTVGDVAPEVTLPQLSADAEASEDVVSLSSLRGSVVYLDFWASWCGPCRLSFPKLDVLRQEFHDQGFEVLAVDVDEYKEDAQAFLEELPVSYLVVRDAEGSVPLKYGVRGMPTGYLIDRQGVVRVVHQGFRKSDDEKLRVEIMHLLEE